MNVEKVLVEADGALEADWEVDLDTAITPELKKKGLRREFVRNVMNLRKEKKLTPADTISLLVTDVDKELREAMEEDLPALIKDLRANELLFTEGEEGEWNTLKVGDKQIRISIHKL